jgi:alpha-beta hydrolase superfamily lysophospholipase
VLLGADSGAAAGAALVARGDHRDGWWPDAVVLAGLPGRDAAAADTDWEAELELRTACVVHRGVLTTGDPAARGSLAEPLPDELLDPAYGGAVGLPQLILVGDADPLADRAALAATATRLSQARLSVVRGAHHDVLNDVQHRSVAAEVVTFLETLREQLVPVIAVESSAW